MAVHDYVVANGTGQAVRQDLNNALAAIVSNNSSSSEPGTTYAYQWWADTNANVLKIRNSSNDGWITLRELDGTMLLEDGSASTPGLAFSGDVDTGIFRSAANTINFATAGAERLEIGSSAVVFNDSSNDVDFRVESNGQTHMLFVDGGNDAVGIATTPEAWEAGQFFALQIGKGGALYGRAAGDEDRNGLTSNCYHSSDGWKYIASSAHATRYDQSDGNHIWFTAGTGTADAAVSFSEAVRIDSSWPRGIGETSMDGLLVIKGDSNASSVPSIRLKDGTDTREAWISNAAGDLVLVNGGDDNTPHCKITLFDGNIMAFETANTERMRLNSSGNLLLGHTSPADSSNRLEVENSIGARIGLLRDDTSVTDGNNIGQVTFYGNDSSGVYHTIGQIEVAADGEHSTGSKQQE